MRYLYIRREKQKNIALVSALGLALWIAGCAGQASSNLLLNGSFENVGASGVPSDWNVDGESPAYRLDNRDASLGKQSLWIEFKDGFNEQGYAGTIQSLDVTAFAGKTLQFSADVRRSNGQSIVGIWLLVADAEGNKLSYVNSYEQPQPSPLQWQKHVLTVKLPSASVKLKLGAAIYDKDGAAWIDNLQLLPTNQ
jgi:hypothetical protein